MRRLIWLALPLLLAGPAAAQQERPREVHVVQPGETLWELARRYLGDPFRWPDIFRLNPAVVEDPDRIYPEQRLRLPSLAAREAARVPPVAREAAAERMPGRAAGAEEEPLLPTVFAHSGMRRQGPRLVGLDEQPPPAFLEGDFQRAGMLVPEAEVHAVGVLVASLDPTVVPLEIPALIGVYDRVYVRMDAAGVEIGERLRLVRPDRHVPPFGRIFEPTGVIEVVALERGTATAVVREVYDAVAAGDLALPMPRPDVPRGVEPVPAGGLEGVLLALAQPQPLVSVADLVFVDLGRASGVTEGDELLAYLPAAQERWGVRPEVPVARLQVVRTTERTSAARVVELEHPALEAGLPVRLVAKMP